MSYMLFIGGCIDIMLRPGKDQIIFSNYTLMHKTLKLKVCVLFPPWTVYRKQSFNCFRDWKTFANVQA